MGHVVCLLFCEEFDVVDIRMCVVCCVCLCTFVCSVERDGDKLYFSIYDELEKDLPSAANV